MQIASPVPPAAVRLLWALDAPRLIGKRIRQRRDELGWSQQKLAEMSGISVRTIPRLEGGEFGRLRKVTADRLSEALGIPADELRPPLEYDDEPAQLDRIEAKLDEILTLLSGELHEALEQEADQAAARQPSSAAKQQRRPAKRTAS